MFHQEPESAEKRVLSPKFGGGPKGLGDPEDRTLRKVELDVLIPKIMREKAKAEKCVDEVKAFETCCKENSILMVAFCRKQNETLRTCLGNWYEDEAFKKECTEIYLKERSEFRRTGIPVRKYNRK